VEDIFLQACKNGNLNLLYLSIQQKVNINCRSGYGLRRAIRYNQKNVWKYLLGKAEIDVNLVNSWGQTALHTAARFNIPEAIADLIKRTDVEVNQKSLLGSTAAMVAAKYVSVEALEVLLKNRKTDIYILDNQQRKIEENIGIAVLASHKESRNQVVDLLFANRLQQLELDPSRLSPSRKSSSPKAFPKNLPDDGYWTVSSTATSNAPDIDETLRDADETLKDTYP